MPHLIASGKTGSGRILRATTICWLVCLVVLAGCKDDDAALVPLTRVKAVTTEIVDFAPSITRRSRTSGVRPTTSSAES